MTRVMMMSGRELRHVPADFDTPIGETWPGWFHPAELAAIPCSACEQTGYSPTARWLHDTFYRHHVPGGNCWGDRLLQADVDALNAEGRLDVICGRSLPTLGSPNGRWQRARLPATVADLPSRLGPFGHDSINVYILVERRCGLLGADLRCDVCDGDCHTFRDDEHRAAHEAWDPQPPTGDHIQLWQTVSEGGPVSPVFPDTGHGRRSLAAWMAEHDTSIHSGLSAADWLRLMGDPCPLVDIATGQLVTAPAPDTGETA